MNKHVFCIECKYFWNRSFIKEGKAIVDNNYVQCLIADNVKIKNWLGEFSKKVKPWEKNAYNDCEDFERG